MFQITLHFPFTIIFSPKYSVFTSKKELRTRKDVWNCHFSKSMVTLTGLKITFLAILSDPWRSLVQFHEALVIFTACNKRSKPMKSLRQRSFAISLHFLEDSAIFRFQSGRLSSEETYNTGQEDSIIELHMLSVRDNEMHSGYKR